MDLRLLRYFAACVEHKSLHAAADVLHVSQPALSKAVQNLEAELGVPLLERRPRGVVATAYGETLMRYAKMIDSDLRHARAEIDALRGATKGEISIGAVPTMMAVMTEVARDILQSNPGLKLKVRVAFSNELTTALMDGEIDLAIILVLDGAAPLGLSFEPLRRTDPIVVARVGHPLTRLTVAPLAALLDFPWLYPTYPLAHRRIISQVFLDAGLIPPVPAMEVSTVVFFTSLIRESDMVTVMPSLIVKDEVAGISAIPTTFPFPAEHVGLAYRENCRLLPGARIVMEKIRAISARSTPVAGLGADPAP